MKGINPIDNSVVRGGVGQGGVISPKGGEKPYEYGWPSGGTSESGVVAQWICDEAAGNIVDETAGTTLVVTGAPTYSVSDLSGLWVGLNPGITYDGTCYHLGAATAGMAVGTDDFVVECVAKYAGGATRPPFSDAQNPTEKGWSIQWNSATEFRLAIGTDAGAFATVTRTVPDTTGQAVKIRVTADRSGNGEVFIDGVSYGSSTLATVAGAVSSYGPMIGGNRAGATKFNGTVYEARLSVGTLTNNSGGPGGG